MEYFKRIKENVVDFVGDYESRDFSIAMVVIFLTAALGFIFAAMFSAANGDLWVVAGYILTGVLVILGTFGLLLGIVLIILLIARSSAGIRRLYKKVKTYRYDKFLERERKKLFDV